MTISLKFIRDQLNQRYSSDSEIVSSLNFDPNDWKRNPYTYFKTRYYIELGTIFTFLFIRFNISANFITLIYAFLGPFAAILISTKSNSLIIVGAIIFFNRGILDWVDGYWASYKKQTSYKGKLLDNYGGVIGLLSLNTGLGIFSFNSTENHIFLYLTIIMLFIHSNLIREYSSSVILRDVAANKIEVKKFLVKGPESKSENAAKKYLKILPNAVLNIFLNIFDGRSRSVDLLMALIILDLIYKTKIIPLAFLLIFLRSTLHYLADLYIFLKGEWLENFFDK